MGVVEAEAMAVPVIVTNILGLIDAMLLEETGFVVEDRKRLMGEQNDRF